MLLGAAGVPQDLTLSRDYDAIFSQLEAAGISVYNPNCQYQENPVALSLGLETDFLPPPFGTADPSVYEAMRAHGIQLVINADQLYNANEPMPAAENDPLLALINAAGRDLIYAVNGYDEPASHNLSVSVSQALYEHVKSIDPTLQVMQVNCSINDVDPAQMTPEAVAAYLVQVAAHAQWADIVGFDVYPIGLTHGTITPYSNGAIVSPAQAVQDYLTWLQTELPQAQHVMVLQGFSMLDVYSPEMLATLDPETLAALSGPSADELASMLTAADGADAVFWWGQSHIASAASSPLWQEVLHQTSIVAANTPTANIIGTDVADTLIGTNIAEKISGAGGDDEIFGDGGADTLVGGAGADLMHGGTASDTYYVDNAGDVVDEAGGDGADSVRTSLATFSLASSNVQGVVENLVGTSGTGQVLSGNALDNVIVGSWGNDTLSGGGGNDKLSGGSGNDSYVVDSMQVTVDEAGTTGSDTILTSLNQFDLGLANVLGSVENLTGSSNSGQVLTGNALDNVITAGNGNDTLAGGGGNDTLLGEGGDDTYIVTEMEVADETGSTGTDTVLTALSGFDLSGGHIKGSVENLTGTSDLGQYLVGNSLNNAISAGAGSDTLDGGLGADTLVGGLGDDLYFVDSNTDVIVEQSGAGTDTALATGSFTLSSNVENLQLTGTAAINGTGNAEANTIHGNSAANVIDGGAGADILAGGAGADTYWVDNLGDYVVENLADGVAVDTVDSTINWTLSAYVENLVLVGAQALAGTGNTLDNVITGNAGANILNGAAGADTMIGGAGNDSYYVDNLRDTVVESSLANAGIDQVNSYLASYTLAANVENGRILALGAANLTGNSLNNTLFAGVGANVMNGGVGTDTVSYATMDSAVRVNLSLTGAQATGGSGLDTLTNFENITGSAFNDVLTGNSGANVLSGGAGADRMEGGNGNDTYCVDNVSDLVVETSATGGVDMVYSYLANYTLGTNVENGRIFALGAANLSGNGLNNLIFAGTGANIINGGSGIDTVSYAAMESGVGVNLSLTGAQATGGSGLDTLLNFENLVGSSFNDVLKGTAGINRIEGGAGNDVLYGGLGNDTLIGGAGNDTFVFNTLAGTGNVDLVQNFNVAEDTIWLENTGVFSAFAAAGALAAGAFRLGTAAADADDRIIFNAKTGVLLYDADGNGAGAATHVATLTGVVGTLSASDFIII